MPYQLIKAYNSGLNSEQVSTLTLDTSYPYHIGQNKVIYSIALDDIREGDVLVFRGRFVITSNEAFPTRSAIMVKLGNYPEDVDGLNLAPGYTVNMDNALHHHFPYSLENNWVADQDYTGKYLNVVAFAAAYSAGSVKVEQGYGCLSAEHFRDPDLTAPDPIDEPQETYMVATGGSMTTIGNYRIHVFDGNGDFAVSQRGTSGLVEILLVGGGGGGANSGGGAGEYVSEVISLDAAIYPVVIGARGVGGAASATGGTDATAGGNSTFAGKLAKGGAPGVRGGTGAPGLAGGSGSGAGASSGQILSGGASTAMHGLGNAGGKNNIMSSPYPSGGGGGASTAGGNGSSAMSGEGGRGKYNAITGATIGYCDGGAGCNFVAGGAPASGGNGSGGYGRTTAGTGNSAVESTGSGGGGAINGSVGGNGAKGRLVVKYRFQ